MPKLIVSQRNKGHEWTHEILEPRIAIGRTEGRGIILNSEGVSRDHAEIVAEGEHFLLIDQGSGNGTYLNGGRIPAHEKHLLRHGDIISIDAFDLRFITIAERALTTAENEVTESDLLEVKLLKTVLSALDRESVPSFEALNGIDEGKKCYLTDDITEMTIGRDPECSFSIQEQVISRKHAKIMKRWGGIAIRDLDSRNGTFINNRRVVEEYLHDGDRIALGTIVFLFRNPQEINIAQIEALAPKYHPAPIAPEDVPLVSGESAAEEPAPEGSAPDALDEWQALEAKHPGAPYPKPQTPKSSLKNLTTLELGLLGLGSLVIIFALITLANLLLA